MRQAQPQDIFEIEKQVAKEKLCMHPAAGSSTCTPPIIRAHTVQATILRTMAIDGHVYQNAASLKNILFRKERKLTRIGVSKASTFTGFCSRHDNALFSPIEKEPLTFSREQLFLLTYRPLCQETFKKSKNISKYELGKSLDRGRSTEDQFIIQNFLKDSITGSSLAHRDFSAHKGNLDHSYTASNYNAMQAVIFELEGDICLMASGVMFPEIDFFGRKLQSLQDERVLDFLAFSLFPVNQKMHAVFSWQGKSAACDGLVDSLLKLEPATIPRTIVRFALQVFENTFIGPAWWDSLSHRHQDWVLASMQHFTHPGDEPLYYRDDQVTPTNWTLSRVRDMRTD